MLRKSSCVAETNRDDARFSVFLFVALLLFARSSLLPAQINTASVRGRIQDSTGTPIPQATVRVVNPASETSYIASSNTEGEFEIASLSPGVYQAEVSHPAFGSQTQKGLEVSPGQLLSLNYYLPSQQQDQAENKGEPNEQSAAAPVNRISESQLIGLPLNGRSYSQLATLQAGVSDPSSASASRGVGGGGLTVSGGRSTSNVFLLDGTNIMNSQNQNPGSAAGVQLGSDAALQVQVFSTNYSAEYGRGSGGILNSITRSGTPQFHGSLFEYLRNSRLDARNFFDAGAEPPPFKRNQFGFVLTGPIAKEKTFFMATFEAMRDRLTFTNHDYYPDAEAREGIITNQAGQEIQRIAVNPSVKPYLDLYPAPNLFRVGGGIGRNAETQFLPIDENFFSVRLDQALTERDSFFARYTFDDATSHSTQPSVVFTGRTNTRQQYLTFVETHIFNPALLNTFRAGYTRPVESSENIISISSASFQEVDPSLFFVPGAPDLGQIVIPGITTFGPNTVSPEIKVMNTFQFSNDVVAQRGPHGLKFGLEVHRYRWDMFSNWNKAAVWSFNSLISFLQGGPDGTNLSVALPGSDNSAAYRQTLLGFYLQDEYQVAPRFHINLGLRYEFTTLIHDKRGKTAFLADPLRDTRAQVGPFVKENPSLRNFSPRLGISWSPASTGNTVLSAGFGIYYDQLLGYVVDTRKSTAPFYQVAIKPNFDASGDFPKAAQAAIGTPLLANIVDYPHPSNPRILRYNFDLQQRFPGSWSVQAAYVGARGNHLFRSYEANLFPFPVTRADGSLFFPPYDPKGPDNRINPNFGSINITASDAQSFYNAFQLSTAKSLGQRFSVRASYTYSKSVDDASSQGGPASQYGYMRTLDRGLSDFNIRHRLTVNYFYTLPFGSGQRWGGSGLPSRLFGNWRVGGILAMRTGTPFNPEVNMRTPGYLFATTRPNLLPGANNNPTDGVSAGCADPTTGRGVVPAGQKLGTPELYFDPCVFSPPPAGTVGNLGRNTVIGPRLFNMDISLQKDFSLGGDRRLQFRTEFFNLFNHTNLSKSVASEVVVFSGISGSRPPSAAKINQTATTARQIQFALRLSF